ncbi:MAG: DUF1559 domain-containing protein [Pirellulaceae bacterium]|nr:DUF1559 domain-containing protein [Pirellulaceae bacterium]
MIHFRKLSVSHDPKREDGRTRLKSATACRRGLTLVELLVVIAIIAALVILILPAIQGAREAARRASCSNQLRQLTMACSSYASAHQELPIGPIYRLSTIPEENIGQLWSTHARILPYLEDTSLDDLVNMAKYSFPASSPARLVHVSLFRCPSDWNRLDDFPSHPQSTWGRNNYKCNNGSAVDPWEEMDASDGSPRSGKPIVLKDYTDGLSKTAMLAEAVLGDGDNSLVGIPGDWFPIPMVDETPEDAYQACVNVTPTAGPNAQASRSGQNWVFNDYIATRYNHIVPPNGSSCVFSPDGDIRFPGNALGATTASSRHPGGALVGMADGMVRFVDESIDVRIWWAMGTRAGGEAIPDGGH